MRQKPSLWKRTHSPRVLGQAGRMWLCPPPEKGSFEIKLELQKCIYIFATKQTTQAVSHFHIKTMPLVLVLILWHENLFAAIIEKRWRKTCFLFLCLLVHSTALGTVFSCEPNVLLVRGEEMGVTPGSA